MVAIINTLKVPIIFSFILPLIIFIVLANHTLSNCIFTFKFENVNLSLRIIKNVATQLLAEEKESISEYQVLPSITCPLWFELSVSSQ